MGSTQPGPVTFDFTGPVFNIRGSLYDGGAFETLHCPTYCPTTLATFTAYRPDGTIIVENQPVTPTTSAGRTIWIYDLRGLGLVKKLVINPPAPLPPDQQPGRAVSFLFEFDVPCPPTNDPVLDDSLTRVKMDSSFQASNPTGPESARRERMRGGYRYPDGRVESIDFNPPIADNCGIPGFYPPIATTDGGILIWLWHSHPYKPWELVTECGGFVLPIPGKYRPGPSTQTTAVGGRGDWQFLDDVNNLLAASGNAPVRMYIFDTQQVYTMLPNPLGQPPKDSYTTIPRGIVTCGI